jgi:GNAT superfamily N-acetyltransferase
MIRRAIVSDRLSILSMVKRFHAESGVGLAFSAALASQTIDRVLADDNSLALVLELDGGLRGIFAATIHQHFFSLEPCAQELVWWVEPAFRGRGAVNMLAEYEAWARSKGCHAVNMVGLGGDPVTTRLYERHGFTAQERHFLKRL